MHSHTVQVDTAARPVSRLLPPRSFQFVSAATASRPPRPPRPAQGMVGVTNAGLARLALLGGLRELELQFCWSFDDEGLGLLAPLTQLSRLDLMYSWKVCVGGVYV